MAADNKTLGRFILDGIPSAPRGIPQVEVKFDLDANGILNVSATDKATNKQQKITITASSGLSKEEIEKMKQEAELHAEEDKKKKEEVEIKNQAEVVVFTTEKMLKESGDKMKAEDKKELEEKVEALKKAKESGNLEDMKKKMEELNTVAQKIGAAMYQQPGAGAPGAGPAGAQAEAGSANPAGDAKSEGEKKDDNVVEGEVEENK
jgi:molecular chaperone DnaK